MRQERPHDPETTVKQGMSTEASGVDEAETMASTGDEDASFQEVAAGTATGLGLDRGESVGTGGLASDEDRDDVAEGDSWLQDQSAAPDASAERFGLEGGTYGWQKGADLEAPEEDSGGSDRTEAAFEKRQGLSADNGDEEP